jgi:heat shock protein HslJ
VARLYDGQTLATPVPLSVLTVQFTDSGRVEGTAGCNSYSARYVSDGASVRLTELSYSGTVCAGPPGIMPQETRFLDALRSVTRYTLTSDTLSLLDAGGRVIVELRDARSPNQ